MAYNYGAPPGFGGGRQTPYGAPPGFGAPPGMAPPGFDAQSPANMQSQFQPPPNMPANFNFAAPVIRLGVDGQPQAEGPGDSRRGGGRGANTEPLGGRSRAGLGSDARGGGRDLERDRAAVRENMMAMQPPTREEVARTIFVGGIPENAPGEDDMKTVLSCAGKLRRWNRAEDADGKYCRFGFAEYEDVDSLEAASEIYKDGALEVPLLDKKGHLLKDEEGEPKKAKLIVVVDEQSQEYIRTWKSKGREDDDARQFRIDGCKEDLRQCLTNLFNALAFNANQANGTTDGDGDTAMGDTNGDTKDGAEVATLPVTLEDELSDIPAEQRAQVAAEIRAFRDRSNKRDLERLRREEELEQAERNRSRINRLASPPPSGPNGAPAGPRGGAPTGPKGYRGAQLPNDYVNGVSFVGGGVNGYNREDEDAEESDEELERRRQARKNEELERHSLDAERIWQKKERTRSAAWSREKDREAKEKAEIEREKALIAKRLADWNDDEEDRLGREEYYYDRSSWLRKRGAYREREERDDTRDRANEERELLDARRAEADARGQADAFLDKLGAQHGSTTPDQPGNVGGAFKISLGNAAAKQKASAPAPAAPVRRGLADVEGLLEDEDDAAAAGGSKKKQTLKPLTDLSTVPARGQDLTDEEKSDARRALASEIPTTTPELFAYPVQWRYLTPAVLEGQIRPFVEKKVLESLGVQEELLVDTVVQGLQQKRAAKDICGELEMALEEEAEGLVRKVWRLVVFWSEAGARSLT